jgi:hypothetical protein
MSWGGNRKHAIKNLDKTSTDVEIEVKFYGRNLTEKQSQ